MLVVRKARTSQTHSVLSSFTSVTTYLSCRSAHNHTHSSMLPCLLTSRTKLDNVQNKNESREDLRGCCLYDLASTARTTKKMAANDTKRSSLLDLSFHASLLLQTRASSVLLTEWQNTLQPSNKLNLQHPTRQLQLCHAPQNIARDVSTCISHDQRVPPAVRACNDDTRLLGA